MQQPATTPSPPDDPAADSESPAPSRTIRRGLLAARQLESGALLVETFSRCTWRPERWQLYRQSRSARFEFNGDRFIVKGTSHGHDGISSKPSTPFTDVTLIARMDIHAEGGATHVASLHLCGEDMPRSPDHWLEITLSNQGADARFQVFAAVSEELMPGVLPEVILPRNGNDGFLTRIDLDAGNNLSSAFVHDGTGWLPLLKRPVKLPIRLVHAEVKIRGAGPPPTGDPNGSATWFDDIRMYPRPASHPILIHLVGQRGEIWRSPKGTWKPTIEIAGQAPRPLSDLEVELWTADGATRVAATRSGHMGYYMLALDQAPWKAYPVSAIVRLRLDGKQFGPDLVLPASSLTGVYPNDVWELSVE